MNEGWIKLHRKFTEWEWYKDANTSRLFIHLLLKANSKDAKWQGELIKRGEVVSSIAHLSEEIYLTIKQVRRAIEKLKKTREVVTKRANQRANGSTCITICKYDDYQDNLNNKGKRTDTQTGTKRANEGQTDGHEKGDKQEYKEEKKNIYVIFEDFRTCFPGKKRGLKTELDNFLKKNNPDVINLLLPALENEKLHRQKSAAVNDFVPPWKNLQTWINKKSWETEFPEISKPVQKLSTSPIKSNNSAPMISAEIQRRNNEQTKLKTTYETQN